MGIGHNEQILYPEFINRIGEQTNEEIIDKICEYLKTQYRVTYENADQKILDFAEIENQVKRFAFFLMGNQGVDDGEYNSSGVITTDQIGDGAITTPNLYALCVEAEQIATGAIEEAKVAADAITATKIAVAGLDGTSGNVAANHIIAGMIQTGAITSVKILADAVTATKIDVVGLNGATGRIVVTDATDANVVTVGINIHAVTLINAGKILISGAAVLSDWSHGTDATLIDGGKIYADSITAAQIAVGTITADEILAGTITADEIIVGGITTDRLSNGMAENFDDLTTGAIHGQGSYVAWGTWATTADASTSAEVAVLSGADKYLSVLDGSGSGHVETELTANSGNELITGVIEWEMRNSVDDKNSYFSVRQGAALSFGVWFKNDGNIEYQCSGGVSQTLQAYSAATWYKIKVHFDCISRFCCIFIDDVFNSRQALAAGALGNYIDRIQFHTNDADVVTLSINDLKIYNVTV